MSKPAKNSTDADPAARARAWFTALSERQRLNRWLVVPPFDLAVLNSPKAPPDALRLVKDWLEVIAADGAPWDMRKAWAAWKPMDRDHHGKRALETEYFRLHKQCVLRELDMGGKVATADNILAAKRAEARRLASLRAEVVQAEEALAEKKATLARLEAAHP
jgi:hypothetical protein